MSGEGSHLIHYEDKLKKVMMPMPTKSSEVSAIMELIIGKVISKAIYNHGAGEAESIDINFTDGTSVKVQSTEWLEIYHNAK